MSNTVIQIFNLSKSYRLGSIGSRTLSEDINRWWARLRKQPDPYLRIGQEHMADRLGERIWALKDINFEVQQGEALGIIGRNGAGKSTLLKILSRITAPTSGEIRVKGRIASLLEVGTGFHPELTGRENIYLNGAILGMKKPETDRKFDEIVDFAGVGKFIDTPVKRYSSGMYVRLAFAVAAHLDPEILVVDEVLAVGDAEFQKKCLGKMSDVAGEGRTVLFVSHNMNMIMRLCPRVILLDAGTIEAQGNSDEIVKQYLKQNASSSAEKVWQEMKTAPGDEVAKLHRIQVCDQDGNILEKVDIQKPFFVEVEYWNLQSRLKPTTILHFVDQQGTTLFASNDWNDQAWWSSSRKPGLVRARCTVPGNFLAEGMHSILVAIGSYNPNQIHALVRDAVSFVVVDQSEGDGARGVFAGANWPGVIRPKFNWCVQEEEISL